MFKQILVVGMMLLSGVASAQQAKGGSQIDVTLDCYPMKQMVEAVVELAYKPLLSAHPAKAKGTFSVWLGPNGQLLVVATVSDLSCIVVDAIDVDFHVESKGNTL
jgi:hypothetical protein